MTFEGMPAKVTRCLKYQKTGNLQLCHLELTLTTENNFKIIKYRYAFLKGERKFAIKRLFDYANPFENGMAVVNVKGKVGVIDKKGNEVVPIVYDQIFGGNLEGALKREEEAKDIDSYFKTAYLESIVNCKDVKVPSNGMLQVKKDGEWKEISVAKQLDLFSEK